MDENIEYDVQGRMRYHSEYHDRHSIPFSESDLEYLCKYYYVDGRKSISMALGRTESVVAGKVHELKMKGLIEYYAKLNKHW